MRSAWMSRLNWIAAGLALSLLGAWFIAQRGLEAQRAAFETDARIVHRLLSQQVVQHDAVLATLALLEPERAEALPRLSAIYPRLLSVIARAPDEAWLQPALAHAEAASRTSGRGAMADGDLGAGRYTLVLGAAGGGAYSLVIALDGLVPEADWPMDRARSPVRVALRWNGQSHTLQAGQPLTQGWRFDFDKVVAAESQPFHAVATRWVGWGELPWLGMGAWALAVLAGLAALAHALRLREARQRAEALLRLGQLGRLNAMGEFAAGLAHELNQPLTAVLASTQAAQRLLADEPPALDTAREAMGRAGAQARRAAEVLARLRRGLEPPAGAAEQRALDLGACVREALHLLQPEIDRRGVAVRWLVSDPAVVRADPIAIDQIVHNLIANALQAMDRQAGGPRELRLAVRREGGQAVLDVADTGPGLPPEVLSRLFEPFFSTREGGLGLGLTLSESLAQAQGGRLGAGAAPGGGALFSLHLPLDTGTPP